MKPSLSIWLAALTFVVLVLGCSRTPFQPAKTLPPRQDPAVVVKPGPPPKGALIKAVLAKDAAQMTALLAQGSDVNENSGQGGRDLTPLLAAIAVKEAGLAEVLIDHGASSFASYGGYRCAEFSARVFGEGHALTKRLRELRS